MALDIKRQNKTYEFSNSSVSKILASKAVGKDILARDHADDAAAKAVEKLSQDGKSSIFVTLSDKLF